MPRSRGGEQPACGPKTTRRVIWSGPAEAWGELIKRWTKYSRLMFKWIILYGLRAALSKDSHPALEERRRGQCWEAWN